MGTELGEHARANHGTVTARPRVLVVAQAWPALGGIPTFTQLLVSDERIGARAEMSMLNTTRVAERTAGTLSWSNVRNAVTDAVRVFRAGRRVDVVHIHAAPGRVFPLVRMLALCAAAKASRAGVLCHVHSGRINGGAPDGFRPGRLYRLLLSRIAFVDAVLTVSDAGTRTLRRLVPRARVETVDNAVDVASFPIATPDQQPATLLFVGTLSRRKGLLDLFEAATQLPSTPEGWRLVVVGGPAEVGEEEAAEIRTAAQAAGFGSSLVGPLHGEPLREAFAAASALVLPSHWEGQPMAILEAMACGLPIVASRVGAIPDVVRHEVDGLLVDAHDIAGLTAALERVLTSPEDRKRWGASARERALARHDMPVLGARLESFYRAASGTDA